MAVCVRVLRRATLARKVCTRYGLCHGTCDTFIRARVGVTLDVAVTTAIPRPSRTVRFCSRSPGLDQHFVSEEEFALPPLGLLPALASGAVTPDMRPAIDMTRRLKSQLPHMLDGHKAIVTAPRRLVDESHKAERPDIAAFAETLMLHAQTEEEVLYPAAILIGEFLEARLGK